MSLLRIQTTDIPLLIEYIHSIFSYCLENPNVSLLWKLSCKIHETNDYLFALA